jgi:hypothetical protein
MKGRRCSSTPVRPVTAVRAEPSPARALLARATGEPSGNATGITAYASRRSRRTRPALTAARNLPRETPSDSASTRLKVASPNARSRSRAVLSVWTLTRFDIVQPCRDSVIRTVTHPQPQLRCPYRGGCDTGSSTTTPVRTTGGHRVPRRGRMPVPHGPGAPRGHHRRSRRGR